MNAAKVVVGLSGGVDSSVAALILLEHGYTVEALFMKNWEEDDTEDYCAASEDLADAERVCGELGIPLRHVNFSSEYWDRVFVHFLEEYRAGRTPNPDILCNQEIKFRAFLEHAMTMDAEYIATGHYAQANERHGRFHLLKGSDQNKDQSYFLYPLGQQQLSKTLFPLGGMTKTEVRQVAAENHLATSRKKDSTGICFIGERPFRAFLERYLPAKPGEIRTLEGDLLGSHDGLMYYTLGQRKGLGIGGRRNAGGEPWFVVDKDMRRNVLIVAQGRNNPLLFSRGLRATRLCWISGEPPAAPLTCHAKTRYRQPDQECHILEVTEEYCQVGFFQHQRAVTPGQSVVFYRGDECLGGGVIEQTFQE